MFRIFFSISIFILFFGILSAQEETNNLNLKGRHSISMSMGLRTNSNSVVIRTPSLFSEWNNDNLDVKTGFMGNFAYNYWFEDEWSVNFQVGVINADVNVNYLSTDRNNDYSNISSNTITPILMGFKYYPKLLSLGNVGRVYAGLNFGAYIGTASKTSYLLFNETTVETVFGAEPNVGVDLFVAKWLRLGPSLSYNVHTKFKSVALNNDDAFGFLVNMGIVF
jgi:hypothetical protein